MRSALALSTDHVRIEESKRQSEKVMKPFRGLSDNDLCTLSRGEDVSIVDIECPKKVKIVRPEKEALREELINRLTHDPFMKPCLISALTSMIEPNTLERHIMALADLA